MQKLRQATRRQLDNVKAIPGVATEKVAQAIVTTRWIVYRSLLSFVVSGLLISVSFFMYGTFYFAFVPSPEHEAPVNLVFSPCDTSPGKCSPLNATVVLSTRNQVLMTGQPYTVSLLLEIPDSKSNADLGMFMNCMQLKTRNSRIIKEKCRSALMEFRSDMIRNMASLAMSPILVTGLALEKQWIVVEFFDNYMDDPLSPAVQIDVQVLSRFIEIYSAKLRIQARFSGLRSLMFHYPISAAIVGTVLNCLVLGTILLLSMYRFFGMDPSEEINEQSTTVFDESDEEEENVEILDALGELQSEPVKEKDV